MPCLLATGKMIGEKNGSTSRWVMPTTVSIFSAISLPLVSSLVQTS